MLNKEFSHKGIVITRGDYESMPCPMYAHEFNDGKMKELVKYIYMIHSEYVMDMTKCLSLILIQTKPL